MNSNSTSILSFITIYLTSLYPKLMNFPYSAYQYDIDDSFVMTCTRMQFHESVKTERLFAYPFSTLIFDYGGVEIEHLDQLTRPPKVFLQPPRKEFINYSKPKNSLLYIFTLTPNAFYEIKGKALIDLKPDDYYLDATRVFKPLYNFGKGDLSLEEFGHSVVDLCKELFHVKMGLVDELTKMIFLSDGTVTPNEVLRRSRLSSGSLNEQFMNELGMSVKEYIHLVKFNSFLEAIKQPGKEEKNFYDKYNFFNYGRLSKRFKQYTGMNISEFPNRNLYLLQEIYTRVN